MLTNVRKSRYVLRTLTNGGHQDSDIIGDFPNLGKVWYNGDSIANTLSLSDVAKVCRVAMDTEQEPAMLVHRVDGSIMHFHEHSSGLYVFKPNDDRNKVSAYTMESTVAGRKKVFTRREIEAADDARTLY